MLPGDFFLVRLHPHDFRSLTFFEDQGYEVRDRITHYNRDFTEDFWLLRSPPDGSIADNVIKHGVGGLNIDACKITTSDDLNGGRYSRNKKGDDGNTYGSGLNKRSSEEYDQPAGRWPANIALSHNKDCEKECSEGCVVNALDTQSGTLTSGTGAVKKSTAKGFQGNTYAKESRKTGEAMISYGDSGGASRFFYTGTIQEIHQWLGSLLSRPSGISG